MKQTWSPEAFAQRVSAGIYHDDAAGAAAAFYGQEEAYKKAVWSCLDATDKKAIAAHKQEGVTA